MKFKSVAEEYDKNPELKKNEVEKLMKWCSQQPHLPDISELEAILFLHSCKFSMELTKQTVEFFFTMRSHCPEIFDDYKPQLDSLISARSTTGIFPLKQRTKENYQVFCTKFLDLNTSTFNFANSIKLFCMTFELWLMENGTVPGHIIMCDLKGCTLGHIARLGPLTMKKFLYYIQDALPIRIAGFHFINIVPFTDRIIALMKPFMKKELADVLHLHADMESFYKIVPLNIIPKEYGGNGTSTDELVKEAYANMDANNEFFCQQEKRRVNEKLRPGKAKNAADIFGAEGNFKKLDID